MFFSNRQERRLSRLERRKHAAMLGARKALAFLEEAVSAYHDHAQSFPSTDEDDTPAFVDLQALRNLAAGTSGWTYVLRKERKAVKTRGEITQTAQRLRSEKVTAVRINCTLNAYKSLIDARRHANTQADKIPSHRKDR